MDPPPDPRDQLPGPPLRRRGACSGPRLSTHAPAGGGGGQAARRRARPGLISSVFPALTPPPGVPASPRVAAATVAFSPRPPPSGGGDDSGLCGRSPPSGVALGMGGTDGGGLEQSFFSELNDSERQVLPLCDLKQ